MSARDVELVRAIEAWFGSSARDLPWRRAVVREDGRPGRDPYHAMVSELMLQQTQVSRVVERFKVFVERFPDVHALAAADESEVLALWSGLGYYRRARLLHAAARGVVREHGGRFPADAAILRELPGIGRYTAGAIASLALGVRTPLVDGNVVRVLLRLENGGGLPEEAVRTGDKRAEAWAWERAGKLVEEAGDPGLLNEGMMELGATVCTPLSPRCSACPLGGWCRAREAGTQEKIPAAKRSTERRAIYCATVVVTDPRGRVAIERRPAVGMWADMWQALTIERDDRYPRSVEIRAVLDARGLLTNKLVRGGSFVHSTTHREVRFQVWRAGASDAAPGVRWVEPSAQGVQSLGLSSAQRRILLGEETGGTLGQG